MYHVYNIHQSSIGVFLLTCDMNFKNFETTERDSKRQMLEDFLRVVVYQDFLTTPFQSSISRFILYGCLKLNTPEAIAQQLADRNIFEAITKTKLIRPEFGSTTVIRKEYYDNNGKLCEHYRSSLTNVMKDIFSGTKNASLLDYHSAQRFAAPIVDGLYAHMECVPFHLMDENDDIIDPVVKRSSKGSVPPYKIDSRFVLTIGWPDRDESPFLNRIIAKSPYPDGAVVNGRISWKEFISHKIFQEFIQELKIEEANGKR